MQGIDKFRERFKGLEEEYVLIGGGACDLLFDEAGRQFRATKDLDLVLLVEALTARFGRVFWQFVREGGYECGRRSTGEPRFTGSLNLKTKIFQPFWSCSHARILI